MPHQCLQCGHAFEEGSSALLRGCPQCKGTRFFYTQDPVSEEERQRIAARAQRDMREIVAEVLQESAPEVAEGLRARAGADGWASIKPKDLRRLVQQVQDAQDAAAAPRAPAAPAAAPAVPPPAATTPPPLPAAAAATLSAALRRERERLEAERSAPRPETVTVHEPGDYSIDVKGLLERNPIVVQKDGAYLIHLPSLFGTGQV